MWLYHALDCFFFFFHTVLIFFNSFGWIFRKTRKWNLITLLLTAFSWFVLGIRFGWGYCFFTDLHWMVRHKLGFTDMADSYIHFLIFELTGINFSMALINIVTASVFFGSIIMSIAFYIKDYRKAHPK